MHDLHLPTSPHALNRRAASLAALLTLLAASLASPGLRAAPATPAPSASAARMTLNFPDADIDSLSRAMASIIGRPIVVDPRVKGKVTLFTDEPVNQSQAYSAYLSALRGVGMAVVEVNGLLKVLPEADAKLQASVLGAGARSAGTDQVATQVFRITYENANNLVAVLRPLITPNNTINVNPGNNTLVITDYQSNLTRLGTIIAALDTPSATDVEVIPLQNAVAAELAVTVQKLVDNTGTTTGNAGGTAGAPVNQGASSGGSGSSIMADVNLNALLVRAANPARLAAIRALVARLDQPGNSGSGGSNVHVVYLKNAEATRMAAVLRAAFPNDPNKIGGGSGNYATSGAAAGGSGSTAIMAQNAPSSTTGGSSSSSTASAQSTSPVSAAAQPSTGGYIQADPATNSLIITAPGPMMREIQAVIDRLDSTRAQVYVESLVVEVDATKERNLGIQWDTIYNLSKTSTITLGSIVEALDSMTGTNVLSTANVVTLDNEEAKIVVGQNVPFVTGSYTTSSTSSSVNPFQTVERKDVGITLRIKPQISQNGNIRLTVYQEASSIADAATGTTNSGPTTNKRSVETNVVVKDSSIVVIGGLIEDSFTNGASGVPGLSSIPLVGNVFRTISRTRKKTNLLVFLRPIVLRDSDAINTLSLDRYDAMRVKQREMPFDARKVLPGFIMPESPPATADQEAMRARQHEQERAQGKDVSGEALAPGMPLVIEPDGMAPSSGAAPAPAPSASDADPGP